MVCCTTWRHNNICFRASIPTLNVFLLQYIAFIFNNAIVHGRFGALWVTSCAHCSRHTDGALQGPVRARCRRTHSNKTHTINHHDCHTFHWVHQLPVKMAVDPRRQRQFKALINRVMIINGWGWEYEGSFWCFWSPVYFSFFLSITWCVCLYSSGPDCLEWLNVALSWRRPDHLTAILFRSLWEWCFVCVLSASLCIQPVNDIYGRCLRGDVVMITQTPRAAEWQWEIWQGIKSRLQC